VPQSLPTMVQPKLVGHVFVFHAAGGQPGAPHVILSSTDLTAPLSAWTVAALGNFEKHRRRTCGA
jgi:hypothetical protein